jgi:uncharacterized protein YdbL (DUF1318 family)
MFALFSMLHGRCTRRLLQVVLVAATLGLAPTALSVWPVQTALAADALATAKASGLVGEQPDGYLGLVKADAPDATIAMVDEINAKRRAEYEKIAGQTSTTVEAVGAVTFEKLLKSGKPGYYLVDKKWTLVQ